MSDDTVSATPLPIAFVTSSGEFGGAEGILYTLLDSIEREWVDTVYVLGPGPVTDDIRERKLPVCRLRGGTKLNLLRSVPALRRELTRRQSRVVHANGLRAACVAVVACLGTARKVIWLKVDCTRDGWFSQALARCCDEVIGISEFVNSAFKGRVRRKLRVVYPGVSTTEFDRDRARRFVEDRLAIAPGSDVVCLAARLSPPKGQLDLIEASVSILKRRPDAWFVLIGHETETYLGFGARLRDRAIELGVQDRVIMLGDGEDRIQSNDVMQFVAGSDILCAPSRLEPETGWKEGFGLSPVEAMWVGTPVVAYSHGSFPEVLGDCAGMVPEGDIESLGDAVVELLTDRELWVRRASCGKARVRRKFTVDAMITGLKARYEAVAR